MDASLQGSQARYTGADTRQAQEVSTIWKPAVRIHDLRHTFASHLVSSGESLPVVGKLLGHTRPQTTARYARLADTAVRDMAHRFATNLKLPEWKM
jgi:site-specific recombinase XerD